MSTARSSIPASPIPAWAGSRGSKPTPSSAMVMVIVRASREIVTRASDAPLCRAALASASCTMR